MKRIGILSDTHSCWDERYRKHFAGCDEIWHAGDLGDITILERLEEIAPVRAVRGNIDHGDVARRCPEVQEFEVEGVKVWMTHIGGYPGRYNPAIRKELYDTRPNLFIAGHSHILKVAFDQSLNCLYINPGAAGKSGFHQVRTLIRFVIDGKNIKDLEVIELGIR